ncbi:YfhO family protein [Planococcus shenhongbingii]|uniref:YfhO family protein n=1 Tax=Planococcus shenhongbingii TaxID=3058398 RepID=UPI0026088222|nr:YfhO family protein [Planococcus sp. N016]WKA58098.1 YfhO family protein [Planococcus sp. N016]
MSRKSSNIILFLSCFMLAAAAHLVFLYQWTRRHYMVGIDDGSSQMLPFKHLLYEQYTSGEFFYSFDFGLGAGTFSELSYYFSTSIVFLISVIIVFILESLNAIPSTDVLFWANAAVFISVVRLSFVLFITSHLFMYMKISRLSAFLGASIYGISGMYFRHTVYWEFFADAFLWLPLLIFGIEKIMREQKPGWFLFAVSISLIDNFYFSYINFLLAGIYILVRLVIRLSPQETGWLKAIATFLITGIIGFGISAVSFVPAVYAFLNNHRPAFEQEIPWIDLSDNILFTSRFIVLPAIFVLFLFSVPLYRHKAFQLFAALGIIGIMLHYSPIAGSIFNGFSAPQYRWEYFLSLVAGGAVAVGMDHLQKLAWRQFAVAGALTAAIYLIAAMMDKTFELKSLSTLFIISSLLITWLLVLAVLQFKQPHLKLLLTGFLIFSLLIFANFYQVEKLLKIGQIEHVNEELLTSAGYNDPEVQGLIEEIHKLEDGVTYRIDWMEDVRNNTPIVQDFRGLSAYSSILNKNLLYFYLYDLEIDMGRESVSRYATLGNRTNLHGLLQGKYSIKEKGDSNVPFGFTEILSSENYIVYENQNTLPFARAASTVYHEQQLSDEPAIVREHAMLTGIVLDGSEAAHPLPSVEEQTSAFKVQEADATYEDGLLTIYGESGGIDLVRQDSSFTEGDLYVSFHLKHIEPDEGFPLAVNDYHTTRKSNSSIYRTFVDDITIRIPAEDIVKIRMPKGKYHLTELQVFEEPYQVLQEQSGGNTGLKKLDIDGSQVQLEYNNTEKDDYLTVNIPFERGWEASVNGEEVDVLKANYAFAAVPLAEGSNEIKFTYRPPFFKTSLIMSVLSLIIGCLFVYRKKH